LLRILEAAETHLAPGPRQHLEQSDRAGQASRLRVEPALLVGLRRQETPVEAVLLRVFAEERIEGGEALQRSRVLRPDLGGDARILEVAPPRHVVLEALV